MTPRRHRLTGVVLVGAVVLAACSSESSSEPEPAVTDPAATTSPTDDDRGSAPASSTGTTDTGPTTEPSADGSDDGATTTPAATDDPTTTAGQPEAALPGVPDDADELDLTDDFGAGGDNWDEGGSWEVDVPGESSAVVIDGVGVMETDLRGTHEWVRALADGTIHEDATVTARITPLDSDEGTVFVGVRGDGEWRDNFQYLPQTGVVLEYGYSPVFAGEFVLVVLDGPDLRRVGPVEGPVLVDGESAEIRLEVVGDRARAKVWRAGEPEPAEWQLEAETAAPDEGIVQIAYRDGVAASVAWDELRLLVWPVAG